METRRDHVPGLDGLRGVAVLMVLVGHLYILKWPVGIHSLGVEVFFVLSGFLITRILLYNREHGVGWKTFYRHRIARLWPLSFAAIIIMAAIWPSWAQFWSFLHVHNLASPWLAENAMPMGHFWSLSVEEQFYGVWPIAVLMMSPTWSRRVAIGMVTLCLLVGLTVAAWASLHDSTGRSSAFIIGFATVPRGIALPVGALLAYAEPYFTKWRLLVAGVACVTLAFIAPALAGVFKGDTAALLGGLHQQTMIAMSLFFLALWLGQSRFRWSLTNRPLCYIGTISYGLYVIHWPVYCAIGAASRHGNLMLIASALGITFTAAVLSFHLYETPMRRWLRGEATAAASPDSPGTPQAAAVPLPQPSP